MRIFHIADTNLGYSAYNKMDPSSGLNQRELDFYNTFERFVDIVLEEKPDLILHAGDFFDSVRPTNRAISFALDQLVRFSEAKIPVVLIAGNHETPRLRETGSVFRLFEHLDGVYPVFKSRYEAIEFPDLELKVHCVPHCMDPNLLQGSLEKLVPDSAAKFNIAMLHGAIVGVINYRSSEFNELEVPSGYLKPNFDYIALGHYHEFIKVDENAYYAGSTERVTFLEAMHKRKGFIEINFEDQNGNIQDGETEVFYPEPIFRELPTRAMVDIPPVDCSVIAQDKIGDEILNRINSIEPEGKIIRLKVQNLPKEVYKTLDFNQFRKLTQSTLHFEFQYCVTSDDQTVQVSNVQFDALGNEFKTFLTNEAIEDLDKDKLSSLGLDYLVKAGAAEDKKED